MRLWPVQMLLFVGCFSLASSLQLSREERQQMQGTSGNVLALLLGDTRKMFATHFYAKADAYFHRGKYPSIFDTETHHEENHMAGEAHDDHDDDEHEPAEAAHDWIEKFGDHFRPSQHVHLEGADAREMLPWLKMSTALDPHRVETYAVTAYWLRERLNKVDEAERLLHDGLRQNPNSPELLSELGRLYFENRKDNSRARNVWIIALRRWHEVEQPKKEPNEFLHLQILGGLVRVETEDGHTAKAIEYLQEMKAASPSPDAIQKRIDELESKQPPAK